MINTICSNANNTTICKQKKNEASSLWANPDHLLNENIYTPDFCVQESLKKGMNGARIDICSNNQAILNTLKVYSCKTKLISEYLASLGTATFSNYMQQDGWSNQLVTWWELPKLRSGRNSFHKILSCVLHVWIVKLFTLKAWVIILMRRFEDFQEISDYGCTYLKK